MRPLCCRAVPALAALGLLLGACLSAAPLHAFTFDARRIGMGSVQVPGGRELAGRNVAYQSVPSRPEARGFVVPLPLGLIQMAADMPTFDPEDPNFDVTRLANMALHPPFFLELSKPSDLDGEIHIALARNKFSVDFADARGLLPQKPLDVGSLYARPLFGMGIMGARTYVSPLVYMQGEMGFDDALYGVLGRGEPVLPNSRYRLTGGGETLAGSAFSVGYSEGGWGGADGNGLYAGAYAKYLMGFAMATATSTFSLSTSDTIFGDQNPMDVDYDGTTRTSRLGRIASGFGVDAGLAYRLGAIDAGIGMRDLGSSLHWSGTEVRHTTMDSTGALVTETLATDGEYTSHLPVQTTLNLAWSGERTVLAADLTTSRLNTALHLGAERRLGWLALRGGLRTDDRSQLQYAWGVGLGLSKLWLDLGFETHSLSITGERGLTLATSLAIR